MNQTNSSMCVGIPVYKPVQLLLNYEIISIKNTLLKCSSLYDICLITPENFDIIPYCKFFRHKFSVNKYHSSYFNGIDGYNKLLKSIKFYESFSTYSHLLIVQTDAFIFYDPLTHFKPIQIHYVGGPWFKNPLFQEESRMFVGNGGYSLRNINKCVTILNSYSKIFSFKELIYLVTKYRFKKPRKRLLVYLYSIYYYLFQNYYASGFNNLPFLYEDVFWGILTPSKHKEFIVPDAKEALKFSFDTKPSLCFELNNFELPTGCHAFHKNEPEFWEKYISIDTHY